MQGKPPTVDHRYNNPDGWDLAVEHYTESVEGIFDHYGKIAISESHILDKVKAGGADSPLTILDVASGRDVVECGSNV